ncbi:hypothetical protein [Marinicauda sp. Alg238-R41]|uniref:hypothetical protein n=1 Tax=Marinicauda sp. Alg238-R41 TaxID=2993447 RepID=UPI0022E33E98|nr:hypothetical protein [Marinicauda sp. Alg238-R41]
MIATKEARALAEAEAGVHTGDGVARALLLRQDAPDRPGGRAHRLRQGVRVTRAPTTIM